MSKSPQSATDIRPHLEAITQAKTGAAVLPVNLFYLLGAGVGTTGGLDFPSSFISYRNLVIDDVTHTSTAALLDITGVSSTDAGGNAVFRVTTFAGSEIDAVEPVNVVATPLGGAPVFLTLEHAIVSGDVEITVHSWSPQGSPAPNIIFDWRCRLASHAAG